MSDEKPAATPRPGPGVVRTSSITDGQTGDRPAPTPRPGGGVTTTRDADNGGTERR